MTVRTDLEAIINETGRTNQDLFTFTPNVFLIRRFSFLMVLIWVGKDIVLICKHTHIVVCEWSLLLWRWLCFAAWWLYRWHRVQNGSSSSCAHGGTRHKSWDAETTWVPAGTWVGKENVVCLCVCAQIYLQYTYTCPHIYMHMHTWNIVHPQKGSPVIYDYTDGPSGHYVKWDKSDK